MTPLYDGHVYKKPLGQVGPVPVGHFTLTKLLIRRTVGGSPNSVGIIES